MRSFVALRSDRALAARLDEIGVELVLAGPVEFGKIIEEDRAKNGKVVAEGNLAQPN